MAFANIPREGEILAGKYRVEGVLGHGGMGVVVAARHIDLDMRVAIKLLSYVGRDLPQVSERFLREARTEAMLRSEHIARVIDFGRLEGGAPYLVMEHLDGTDLARVLKERGRLPIGEAVAVVSQACEAIAEAHGHGIVHRDLKPANLFIARRLDGSLLVKVIDFGICKAPSSSLTDSREMLGTASYTSPEQLQSSKDVDARADVWALGVILYVALTGRRPFEGSTTPEVWMSILSAAPPPVRSLREDVPPELAALVERCLEKERDRRVQSAAELFEALAPFGSPGAARAPSLPPSGPVSDAPVSAGALEITRTDTAPHEPPPPSSTAAWPSTRRRGWVAAGVTAALLFAVTAVAGAQYLSGEPAPDLERSLSRAR